MMHDGFDGGNCTPLRRSVSSAHPPDIAPHLGWLSRGYLPHYDKPGLIQHITFRLSDCLPALLVDQIKRDLLALPEEKRDLEERIRTENLADAGHGCCILREPWAASMLEQALLHFDGERYRILAWCIMPNHVHVLVEMMADWPLSKVVQNWRGYTGHKLAPHMAAALQEDGTRQPWQRGYWDRYIRDAKHYSSAQGYIERNPVKAGLVARPVDWPWSSAGRR